MGSERRFFRGARTSGKVVLLGALVVLVAAGCGEFDPTAPAAHTDAPSYDLTNTYGTYEPQAGSKGSFMQIDSLTYFSQYAMGLN